VSGVQRHGIMGNKDGSWATIEKSQKRLQLGQVKRYSLEIYWEIRKRAHKDNGMQKCRIPGNKDGSGAIIEKSQKRPQLDQIQVRRYRLEN